MKRYEQVMKELHHKKTLLQQAVVRELLLDPSYITDIRPDDVHAFDDLHQKYIQAALYLQDQFSIISLRSYLLSQGMWTQNDENYLARILSSTSNTPITYALPELRRISASISVYEEIYHKLVHAMISGETPTHLNVLPVRTDTEPPEREWLIPHFLPKNELTILAGIGSIGKTTLALQMAISLLSGKNFHPDLPCQGISRVMILSAEDDYHETCRKAHRITQAMEVSLEDGLHFYTPDEITTVEYGVIRKTREYDQIQKYIHDNIVDLVIVDSLTSVFAANLTDPTHMRYVIRLLRDLPCSTLVLHHLNKLVFKGLDDPDKLMGSVFGSVAITNLTRHVLCLHDHFLFTLKSNIGPKAGLYSFLRYHGAYEVGHRIFVGDEVDRELNIIKDQHNGNSKNGKNKKREVDIHENEPF